MWANKSNDGGATWQGDMEFSDVVTPLAAEQDPNIFGNYAGDYDYGSALLTKHMSSWMDGRNVINGQSQQDAFTDRELVGFAVTTSDPACNSVVSTQPTDFIINLSDPVDPTTVQPTDFTVNGTPANSHCYQRRHHDNVPLQQHAGDHTGPADDAYPCGAFNRVSERHAGTSSSTARSVTT